MIITKKRIRNIKALGGLIEKGGKFFVGIKNQPKVSDVLPKIGFFKNFHSSESILPPAVFGPISLYNAEGKYKVHKNKPMETAYRTAEWHWKEWRGRYDTVEQSKLVDVPYKRYPRTFIEPPSIEITAYLMDNKEQAIISPIFELNEANKEKIIHTVKVGEYDEEGNLTGNEIHYSCDPSENGEHIYVGFLTKSKNPFGYCMPCCFKKDPFTSLNREKMEFNKEKEKTFIEIESNLERLAGGKEVFKINLFLLRITGYGLHLLYIF